HCATLITQHKSYLNCRSWKTLWRNCAVKALGKTSALQIGEGERCAAKDIGPDGRRIEQIARRKNSHDLPGLAGETKAELSCINLCGRVEKLKRDHVGEHIAQ